MLSPNSVSTSLRVLRCISRSPNAFSSSVSLRDKVDLGRPVKSDARVKLPASATWKNRIRSLAYSFSDDDTLPSVRVMQTIQAETSSTLKTRSEERRVGKEGRP